MKVRSWLSGFWVPFGYKNTKLKTTVALLAVKFSCQLYRILEKTKCKTLKKTAIFLNLSPVALGW